MVIACLQRRVTVWQQGCLEQASNQCQSLLASKEAQVCEKEGKMAADEAFSAALATLLASGQYYKLFQTVRMVV